MRKPSANRRSKIFFIAQSAAYTLALLWMLINPAAGVGATVLTATSATVQWSDQNTWSISGPGFGYSGTGESEPTAILFMFPGTGLSPFPGGFSGYTAEYRGAPAVNTGFFTIDGITYGAGAPNEFCSAGLLHCGLIAGTAGVNVSFTVPIGPAVITIPTVLSGQALALSCSGATSQDMPPGPCPLNPPSATIDIGIPGKLTIDIGAPYQEGGVYVEPFTAEFSGSVPEPKTILLLAVGLGVLLTASRKSRWARMAMSGPSFTSLRFNRYHAHTGFWTQSPRTARAHCRRIP